MITSTLLMLAVGLFAGIMGAILGIGGGMIITPIITLALGLDIKYAIGASIIAVIATSSGSTIAFLKDDVLNLRVAMFLEIATTIGAIVGAILTGMFGAGIASGMLGIGSGAFKVMAMDNAMKMPLKPSSATSNLMMGVTAAASASVYFFNGSIKPGIAVPLALGILVGAAIGSRIMQHLPSRVIRMIFIPILLYLGLQMIFKAFGVTI